MAQGMVHIFGDQICLATRQWRMGAQRNSTCWEMLTRPLTLFRTRSFYSARRAWQNSLAVKEHLYEGNHGCCDLKQGAPPLPPAEICAPGKVTRSIPVVPSRDL